MDWIKFGVAIQIGSGDIVMLEKEVVIMLIWGTSSY